MKYGLNMMGVCDLRGRFLWVEARFPCAASDFYAFDDSHLKKLSVHLECLFIGGACYVSQLQ